MKWSLAPLIALSACAAGPEIAGSSPGAPSQSCSAESLADLIGEPATAELGQQAQQRSGARSLRWIRPEDAVTMDYRHDRLNVHLDGQQRVERFACG